MASSSSTHYALVNAGSNPIELEPEENDASSSASAIDNQDPRRALTQVYQHYAELYPNPRLVEEYRQRNTLLQAASAAANAQSQQQQQRQQPSNSRHRVGGGGGGFFARLFGGGAVDSEETNKTKSTDAISSSSDAPLVYTDLPNEHDDGSLCGTLHSLDPSCIPLEAYSVARFHLTSQSTRGGDAYPNAVRWGPLLGRSIPTSLIVVGLGVLAEFQPNQPSTIRTTADCDALKDYARAYPGEFQLEYVRACGISPNCIAISWGFQDGLVGIYRRIQWPRDDSGNNGNGNDHGNRHQECGWEQLWMVGPSPAVLDAIGDVFHDDESHPGSPLLRVADLLPLRVSTGDRQRPMVTTLALARLGGYLELVPVPTELWFGPLLTPENHRRPKPIKRKRGQHYAIGKSIGSPTIALTTGDYHLDAISLDALRTTVGLETEWNNEAFPDGPPSEYIVAISGLSARSPGLECVSFWSVCTLFTDGNEQDKNLGFGFQLHASFLDATEIVAGAQVSVFATSEIMQHWRRPRHVELRPDAALTSSTGDDDDDDDSGSAENLMKETRVTTISTPAPVVSMQFLDQRGSALLAVVDWNGGTTLYDCTAMEHLASHQMSWKELAQRELAATGEGCNNIASRVSFPLHRTLATRTQFANCIGRRNQVGALQWLKPTSSADEYGPNIGSEDFCPLVLLLRNEQRLMVVTLSCEGVFDEVTRSPTASVLSLPFPGQGATMGDLGSGNLLFVSKQRRSAPNGALTLKFFVMQHLQPTAIVESLAQEHKYEEAIAASQTLDELDQATLADVVEMCHRRIWEAKRDIDNLADTRNIAYIVEQAVTVCESTNEEEGLSFEKLRILCRLATTMGRNHGPSKESLAKTGTFLIRLGTYELLCQRFATVPVLHKFRSEFQLASMVDVAKSLAKRGDVSALTIVVFRHRLELVNAMFDILASIPLSIHPEAFVHLLPVLKDGRITDTFLPTTMILENASALHLSHLPQHMHDTEHDEIVIDNGDEKLVLEHNATIALGGESENWTRKSSRWFVDRSTKMQHFTGNMDSVIVFCESGLRCNGFKAQDSSASPTEELQPLFKTWRSATALQKILLDDFVAFDGGSEESKESGSVIVSTDDLLSMELPELVDLVLRSETDSAKILSRCNEYLHPLLLELNGDSTRDDGGQRFDHALSSYCSGLTADCLSLSKQSSRHKTVELATRTVGTCAAIAASSKTSIRRKDRLIKDKKTLIELVLRVIQGVSSALEKVEVDPSASKELINAMWTMYEALPDRLPSSMQSSDTYLHLLEYLDVLFVDLIFFDVLSRWPRAKPFAFLAKERRRKLGECGFDEKATNVIVTLCKSFMANVQRLKTKSTTSSLLQDLLSDIEQLKKSCDQVLLELPQLLCTNLVRPLLQLEYFHLLIDYCNADSSLVDKEQVKGAVLAYVDEAVFSEGENTQQIMSAMKCQDILGPAFPEIQPGFLSIRRYLDAAHFISTVIYEGRNQRPMRPVELRKQFPLDVVETIIQDVPHSVVCGCSQWQDERYAISSNETIRRVGSKRHPDFEAPQEMPSLPGGAIFHLATIMGLEDDKSALVVKCRVIHHAVSVGLYGAAAAICRTMFDLNIEDGTSQLQAIALAKLGAVAEIVSDENYTDIATKQELCQAALVKYAGRLEITNSGSFSAICAVSATLDHRMSRHSREQKHDAPQRQERLMARPFSRLQRHILAEYNADVHGLVADLMSQTSNGLVHDSLMNALSRFVIYWCVSDSKTLRSRLVMAEKNDARENLALGCSLILHIPSKLTAGNCVHELQKIAADQAANVSTEEHFGSDDDDICIPEPQIVARMIRRGYAENAARRAVIMTRNAGYNEALGWAVMHTLDPDFNKPVVVVQDPRRTFIDEDAIQLLQKGLYSTQCRLDDENAMNSLLSFFRSVRDASPTDFKPPRTIRPIERTHNLAGPAKKAHQPVGASIGTKTESMLSKPILPVTEPKTELHPSTHKKAPMSPEKITKVSPRRPPPSLPIIRSIRETSATPNKSTPQPPPRPVPVASNGSLSEQQKTSVRPPILSSSTPRPQVPSSSRPAGTTSSSTRASGPRDTSNSRSELLKRGQEALSKRRNNGEAPDRSKLIAEGREFLRKSRSTKVAPNDGSSSTPTPPPARLSNEATPKPPAPRVVPPPDVKTPLRENGATNVVDLTKDTKDDASEGSGWDFDNFDDM